MQDNREKTDRNDSIYADHKAGLTYPEIAAKHDVSIQRARVLVRRHFLREENAPASPLRKRRPCTDPYNRDTGIEVFYHGHLREFIAIADDDAQAKRVARRDAKETERPLRNYHWHRTITQVQPLFAQDTDERTSKIGVSYGEQ